MPIIILGKIAAWSLIVLSVFGLGIAIWILFTTPDAETANSLARRYLGSDPIGKEIDQRFLGLGVGITIGLLAEIARRLGPPRNKSGA